MMKRVAGLIVFFLIIFSCNTSVKENEENYPLHNGKFDFNEDIFPYAVCALYNVISTIE